MEAHESRVDPSRKIEREHIKAFTKQFEDAIEILEDRYHDETDPAARVMLLRITKMQELRNGWRGVGTHIPTEQELFTMLQEVALHILPENSTARDIKTATAFYLVLVRMQSVLESTWLACNLFDLRMKLLRDTRSAKGEPPWNAN